ncbi:aminopeptidase N [Prochlorococcus sp. MIT 1341]|uniref:aminopeptidase N n=1 Tax=Prochlorococcus sp. MIT 1341 TaxID=3096221 RepID=UPI002A74FBBB|nr:aminopeptidase N [Prochlorococcus sp. MIT 1341]
MKENTIKYIHEYKPYPFNLPEICLEFKIGEEKVKVISKMKFSSLKEGYQKLILKGIDLQLISLKLDHKELGKEYYSVNEDQLTINRHFDKNFVLEVTCIIDPFNNTSLEGLYASEGLLTTQCEAEGFRRICYHPDRPDVLSKYNVKVSAPKEDYPTILSNGNLLSDKFDNKDLSIKVVEWEDPYPKPSYLFGLVLGKLYEKTTIYQLKSGKNTLLRFHTEKSNLKNLSHAMSSLKKAIEWDEKVYDLEYDLEQYNIVAVRHFNMGAMENKSLNIFNSKLIIANEDISTDRELERVESVIAHEYFHNWTGNRVTCRDWFQLSLKEGLTVYRDQCFTSDLHSSSVKRIEDVSVLRNIQFKEDNGPTSHAVKPSRYKSIDNFYTTTIYEKGAELIRMLEILIGKESFNRGIRFYLRKYDGSAATTEDFINSIAESTRESIKFDLNQFKTWYYRKGTPKIKIKHNWDPVQGKLKVTFSQCLEVCDDQNTPFLIPIKIKVFNKIKALTKEHLFILDKMRDTLLIDNLPRQKESPYISLFRDFSAPVIWESDIGEYDLLELLKIDDDPFSKWDAAQKVIKKILLSRAKGNILLEVEHAFISTLSEILSNSDKYDLRFLAKILSLPCLSELESEQEIVNPIAMFIGYQKFQALLGEKLSNQLHELLSKIKANLKLSWPQGVGQREITAIAWKWLAQSGDKSIYEKAVKAVNSNSMSIARAGLDALNPINCPQREEALQIFYQRWKDSPVILDTWFNLNASNPHLNSINKIKLLMEHPKFDPIAPNAIRAVLGGFTNNPPNFHAIDGSGYTFMAEQIIILDSKNAITASRLVKIFSNWKKYNHSHRSKMKKAIEIVAQEKISSNTREIIELIK